MKRREFITTAAAASALLINGKAALGAIDEGTSSGHEVKSALELFTPNELKPDGDLYEATVPDTLDLAEHARLAVRGLINFLDPSRSYENYQIGYFNTQPAYMSHFGSLGANWGKVTEGILKTRHMCGSTESLDREGEMFKGIFALMRENGEFGVDSSQSWVQDEQKNASQTPANTSRMLIAFMAQNEIRPSPRLGRLIAKMADSICAAATVEGDCAYLPGRTTQWRTTNSGVLGSVEFIWDQGESLRGIMRAYALTRDKKYLDMGEKLTKGLLESQYWVPEVSPKAVVGGEHGQFNGHIHSYVQSLMGMLDYAGLANDARLKEFVRESYEFCRTFGIARIGMYGEMCATGDMTKLAIALSDLGVGDYWEDVDQYVRNQLIEGQVTDAEKMHRANAAMPQLEEAKLSKYAVRGLTTDHVIDRFVGAWRSDASNPAMTNPENFLFVVCCSGNNPPALYAAWEATVRYNAGVAQVNLLLNRASPWLDMDSYLPYEGKVVIRNKAAKEIFVRIPRWVDDKKLNVEVNGKSRTCAWVGRHVFVDGVKSGDQIRIDFPMVESTEIHTLLWKPQARWLEGIDPGPKWQPDNPPERYTLQLKGNTVVDVSPRPQGPGYPVYERTYYARNQAPTKQVTRYVSGRVVKW